MESFVRAIQTGDVDELRCLLEGADINGIPSYSNQSALYTAGALDTRRATMVAWLKSKGAKS